MNSSKQQQQLCDMDCVCAGLCVRGGGGGLLNILYRLRGTIFSTVHCPHNVIFHVLYCSAAARGLYCHSVLL